MLVKRGGGIVGKSWFSEFNILNGTHGVFGTKATAAEQHHPNYCIEFDLCQRIYTLRSDMCNAKLWLNISKDAKYLSSLKFIKVYIVCTVYIECKVSSMEGGRTSIIIIR